MWIVAVAAIQLLPGLPEVTIKKGLIFRIVTIQADGGHRLGEERNVFTAVRHVAGETVAVFHGRVRGAFCHPCRERLVTEVTEASRFLDEETRQLSGVRHVATGALTADEGTMLTPRDVGAEVHVVTVATEFTLRRCQQAGHRRPMRHVAAITIAVLEGRVYDLCLGDIRHAFVTFSAQLIPAGSQQPGEAGLVGIMTGHAFASQHGFVNSGHTQPLAYFIVALRTEFSVAVRGQARIVRPVRNVAAQTVTVLEWGVNHFHTLATGTGVTVETELARIHREQVGANHAVRLMAVQAVFTGWSVARRLQQFIADIVVALETDLVAGRLEERRQRRAVRRVAFQALRVADRIVDSFGSHVGRVMTVTAHLHWVG